ncbi:MAG TPA: twin-arginine translocation signal domain-containing protein, partial [Bacteroidota bacterium]|nr:twin-arginine translocation signal domain-containing protein [Bacteroidota bacterium]
MTSRRDFLKHVGFGTASLSVGWDAKSYARILGANDRVQFGIIGLHGRAYAHMEAVKAATNATVTHVCDVDRLELDKFAAAARTTFGRQPQKENDFRRLLESPDVD